MPIPCLLPGLRDRADQSLVAVAAAHALALVLLPGWPVVALGMWWTGNTLAHQCVHRRLFTRPGANAALDVLLTLLLGLPQSLWADRHHAHHAGTRWRFRTSRTLAVQLSFLAALWLALAWAAPGFVAAHYVPGLLLGLGLCWLQGHQEHCRGTISCYARWWNRLFFDDGYHVEHHRWPALPLRLLPARRIAGAARSPWPPVLRWLEAFSLTGLERLVLRCGWLQRRVLAAHRRALRRVLQGEPAPRRIVVVGGGLFPRSAILLRERFPSAAITVLDADAAHLRAAGPLLPRGVAVRHGVFTPGQLLDCDLAVLPLALCGDRARCYAEPPAPRVLVHDWLWRCHGRGARVAFWLGKRLNLVRRSAPLALARAG